MFLPACQKDPDKEPGPKQRGHLVHGFEELANCIPTGNDEYAWLLTSNYSSHLAPNSVYLANQYGQILPEKKPLSGEKVNQIWAIPNVPYQLWAASNSSLFLIDVPQNNAPLIDQAKFTSIFGTESKETISRLGPIPNSRSAWLITQQDVNNSIQYSLHFINADASPRVKRVALPEGIEIRAVFSSPKGNSAWLVWQKGFTQPQGGAMFLENKDGEVSARNPIIWEEYGMYEVVPIKEGALAWKINRDYLLPDYYFAGSNPALISSEGGIWSVSDRVFEGAPISYAVSENIGDELPMWAWVERKPGVYLLEATREGPRITRRFLEDVLPQSIVPSRDGKSAWVLDEGGSSAYRLAVDGSAQKFELTLGDGLRATSIRPSQNGQKAWVVAGQPQKPGESEAQQSFSLFYLDSQSEPNLKKIPLTVKSSIVLPAPDNEHAFSVDPSVPLEAGRDIKELKYYILRDADVENGGQPLLTVDGTSPTSGAKSFSPLWVRDGKNRCWVVRWKQGAIASASVSFNNTAKLTFEQGRNDEQESAPTLSPGTTISSVTVDLTLEGQRSASAYDGSVQLFFIDGKNDKKVVKHTPEIKLRDSTQLPLDWPPALAYPYDIDLVFRDQYGTRSVVRWSKVEFAAPLWQRPWVLTVFLFLVICVASAVLTGVLKRGIRRWLPLLFVALGSAITFLTWLGAEDFFDAKIFAGLVLGSGIVLLLISLVSPTVFQTLAQIQPFQKIIPHFLRWSKLRRKMFSPYVESLRGQLSREREEANFEVYIPIPATIQHRNAQKQRVPNPANEIAASLTELSGPKTNVLITAPGGTGKSALLREVVGQTLTRFLEDPRFALPIICKGGEKSLEEMAQDALGKHAISPEILASQIDAGHFFLVIDGPQEAKLSPEQIGKWVKSERAETAVLLIASRPKDDIRQSLQLADQWCLVTPERLTDETIDLFQNRYIDESDPPPPKLTPALKELCRGTDGSYLPILVRLALIVGSEKPHSIAELYEMTFQRLLGSPKEQEGLLDQAGAWCVETYWHTGQRTIVFDRAKQAHSQLMKRLMEAGVLVPWDVVGKSVGEPREVRFFHDSMQSYLTARGLLNGEDPWSQALSIAAAHPRFREAQHSDDPEHGSELFRMCLQVFGTGNELQQALRSDLLRWATIHDKNLTRNDVEQSLPEPVQAELNHQVPDLGAGAVLTKAVELLTTSSDSKTVQQLGGLYARIAEKAWALETKDGNASQAPIPPEQTPA